MPAEFDRTFLEQEFRALREFAGGGAWRRKKYLAELNGSTVLLKFAGLGSMGERKLRMARALHAAGFTPEPLGLAHGFLVERWVEGQPLSGDERPVEEIGRYIGARARLFPEEGGASIQELLTMIRRNISLALGDEAASQIGDWGVQGLARKVRRLRTDNKMDREEWLRTPEGRLLKTDALDHHQGHDLVGCQGVEWDVAGAIDEFELAPMESARLIHATDAAVDPEVLEFYRLAYAAFRVGQAELARDAAARERHARSLHHLLHQKSCACEVAGILA